jgi:type I restriction enzyme M protein
VKYYAQELKENTYNLTRMNLVMRGIKPNNIETRCADSLDEDWPIQKEGSEIGKPLYVDAVVSNPPYSQHWTPDDAEMDARFKDYGVAPKTKADYAFLLHELHHLKPDGILTIVLPHGVLFRGDTDEDSEGEGKIRRNLIEKNNIDAIIGLPANIFFGTGIPTLIMVLKQHRENDDVLIIDASKGFVKEGKNNKLRACDIKRIADTVRDRATIPCYSRTVSRQEIRDNGYNLNIPRYVDSSEPAEQYDIYATMFGGIPESEIDALQPYWDALPSLRGDLFETAADKPYASVKSEDVTSVIESNADVRQLKERFNRAFADFADQLHHRLITNVANVKEMTEQDEISNDIFRRLQDIPLVDKYDAYQVLAANWQTIVNDIETIQTEGMDTVRVVETAYKLVKKGDEELEVADGLKGRILPFELVQHEMFQDKLDAIEALQAKAEGIAAEIEDLRDELSAMDDTDRYFEEDDTTKLIKKVVTADSKLKKGDIDPEVKTKLQDLVSKWAEQSKVNKGVKSAKSELEELTVKAIESLSDENVEKLLHKKWVTPICEGIHATLTNVFVALEKIVVALDIKYANSFSAIEKKAAKSECEFSNLITQLTGDEYSIKGLLNLIKE